MGFSLIFFCLFKTKATIGLTLLITGSFLFLSNNFYIPQETIEENSFGLHQPEKVFYYELVHIGPNHLASNAITLLLFGVALELSLSSIDVLAIFFSSTIITAFFFALLNPFASVIGASAGIISMITAAFFSSPKKTIIAATITIFFGALIFFALNSAIFSAHKNFEAELVQIKSGIQKAVQENNTEKQQQLEKQLQATVSEKNSFEQSNAQEKYAVSDLASHAFAAVLGIAYVFAFHRKKFFDSAMQTHKILGKARKILSKKKRKKQK